VEVILHSRLFFLLLLFFSFFLVVNFVVSFSGEKDSGKK
jgi:hypothetical protein